MEEYWIKSVKRRIVADCAFIEILKTNIVTTWAIIKIIYFVHVSFQVVQVNVFFFFRIWCSHLFCLIQFISCYPSSKNQFLHTFHNFLAINALISEYGRLYRYRWFSCHLRDDSWWICIGRRPAALRPAVSPISIRATPQ